MKNLNFNKNSGKIVLVAVLCAIVIHIVQVAYGSVTAESVSEDDTLVSLSYVNSKFQKMAKKLEEAEKRLEEIEKYGKFEALELTKGQVLIAGASAELILRGGKALAIGGEGGGLSDITSGTGADVNTDDEVPLNHLLLVSRDDGRGLKVTSEKAWVLVKGPYTIK